MNEWISVTEDLPYRVDGYYTETVIVYCPNGLEKITLGHINWDECIFDDDGNLEFECGFVKAFKYGWGRWEFDLDCLYGSTVTHWMPLPKPPEDT